MLIDIYDRTLLPKVLITFWRGTKKSPAVITVSDLIILQLSVDIAEF